MALRTYRTGTVTMTGATATSTFSNVHGTIKKISIKPSGTSTDFNITYDDAGITSYVLGSTGTPVSVVTAGKTFYPVTVRQGADGVDLATAANIHVEHSVNGQDITISVSAGATSETYSVVMIVEE